ncbi:hypothetical protein ACFW9N_39035 [Streptomyces sp. NPDC059496]|uniref:hypothetical protein n=1 Tax=Streptomyces sp. NPDC059496 TaxID=3346851 RepID=UPI00369B3638
MAFHLDDESDALSARDAKGEEIAGSPTPMVWDSSGKVATTDDQPAEPRSRSARGIDDCAVDGCHDGHGGGWPSGR